MFFSLLCIFSSFCSSHWFWCVWDSAAQCACECFHRTLYCRFVLLYLSVLLLLVRRIDGDDVVFGLSVIALFSSPLSLFSVGSHELSCGLRFWVCASDDFFIIRLFYLVFCFIRTRAALFSLILLFFSSSSLISCASDWCVCMGVCERIVHIRYSHFIYIVRCI